MGHLTHREDRRGQNTHDTNYESAAHRISRRIWPCSLENEPQLCCPGFACQHSRTNCDGDAGCVEQDPRNERLCVRNRERSMTRKTVTRLLDIAELCDQGIWPGHQAHRVFQVALELAKARDNEMLLGMRNRLGVENSNDG